MSNKILSEIYKNKIIYLMKLYNDINDKFYYGVTYEELKKHKPSETDVKIFRDPESDKNSSKYIEAIKKLSIWKLMDASIDDEGISIADYINKLIFIEEEEKEKEILALKKQIIEQEEKKLKEEYILFFDTETTGLPKNWKAPLSDLDNWPRLVQLAYILYNEKGIKIQDGNFIVKPEGFIIPNDSSNIHGITNERAIEEGISLNFVLQNFENMIKIADYIVAHNMSFDEKIIRAEFSRKNIETSFTEKKKICTMEKTTNYCAINGPYGYKWPKLSELYYKLFKSNFEEAHNAAVDIKATSECFWELKKRNII